MNAVLCVDDDAAGARVLSGLLRELGYEAHVAVGVDAALMAFDRRRFGAVIVSLPLRPAGAPNGHAPGEALEELEARANGTPLLAIARHRDAGRARAALENGVLEYLVRPVRREALRLALRHAIDVGRLRHENERMRHALGAAAGRCEIVGRSAAMQALLATLAEVAPTPATVLIEGEAGTGKTLLARAIHDRSPRHERPLAWLDCAREPAGGLEAALFGADAGGRGGAAARPEGELARAIGGTLVLEEIAAMGLELQSRLARALARQDCRRMSVFERPGGDVRVIATSRRDLEAEVAAGRFHPGLHAAIAGVPLRLPALRDRADDIPPLVTHFVRALSRRRAIPVPRVPATVLAELVRRPWPGNVRELEETIACASASAAGGVLRLPPPGACAAPSALAGARDPDEELPLNLRVLERATIERALGLTRGNRLRASRLLGITDRTLRNKLRVHPHDES